MEWDKILEGVVSGISSGVITGIILAIFFWGANLVRKIVARRDEVRFLAALIENFRDKIYSAEDINTVLGNQPFHYTRDNVRKAYFDNMRRQIKSVLEGRSASLSYDEVEEVNGVFFSDFYPDVVLNESSYEKVFAELESFKWLKLSPRTS